MMERERNRGKKTFAKKNYKENKQFIKTSITRQGHPLTQGLTVDD